MAFKIFVGSLPWKTTDADLSDLFATYGTVESARIIMNRDTGQSKGFGFVELSTEEEGRKAIEALDGKDYEGRNLAVSEARPMEERR